MLSKLGIIQRHLQRAEGIGQSKESFRLLTALGEQQLAAVGAFNIGLDYTHVDVCRDFAQAEQWFHRSLELSDPHDEMWRGNCCSELAAIAYLRAEEARQRQRPRAEQFEHLNTAASLCFQALDLLPSTAVNHLAIVHQRLGKVFADVGDLEQALPHFHQAIRYKEGTLDAAELRYNVAVVLAYAGRLDDATEYAHAALSNFATFGSRAAEGTQKVQKLIALIKQAAQEQVT